jgi:hypothetical protein
VFSYDPIYDFSMPFNIKAPLGGMFADYLHEYTHWGWVDLDTVMGDMSKMIDDLKQYHIAIYTEGVCLLFFTICMSHPSLQLFRPYRAYTWLGS